VKIEEINLEVGHEYGKVLPLRIVGDPAPNFNWESINIPEWILKEPSHVIRNILRHEYGHLFINPKSVAVAETMVYIAKSLGFSAPNDIANIVSDLIVDSVLIDNYREGYMSYIDRHLSGTELPRELSIMASFYRYHADLVGIHTDISSEGYHSFGRSLHRVLIESDEPYYQRVYGAMRLIKKILGEKEGISLPHSVITMRISKCNEINVRKELAKSDLEKFVFEHEEDDLLGAISGYAGMFSVSSDPVRMESVLMEIENTRLLFYDAPVKGGIIYDTWFPGDDVATLDALRSIESSGVLIPSVTTQKRKASSETNRDSKVIGAVAILLDSSGSMRGRKFVIAQSVVMNILQYLKRKNVSVSLIPFSADIDMRYIINPTYDYEEIISLLLKIEPSGGTRLSSAMDYALNLGVDIIVIITDADIYDAEDVLANAQEINKVIILISKDEHINVNWAGEGDKILRVLPEGIFLKEK